MLTSVICGQRGKIDRQQVRCHMVGTSDPTVREFVHVSDWSDEETRDPLYADDRNFFKVEQWTPDGKRLTLDWISPNLVRCGTTWRNNWIRLSHNSNPIRLVTPVIFRPRQARHNAGLNRVAENSNDRNCGG
jgi:hypothetical protein